MDTYIARLCNHKPTMTSASYFGIQLCATCACRSCCKHGVCLEALLLLTGDNQKQDDMMLGRFPAFSHDSVRYKLYRIAAQKLTHTALHIWGMLHKPLLTHGVHSKPEQQCNQTGLLCMTHRRLLQNCLRFHLIRVIWCLADPSCLHPGQVLRMPEVDSHPQLDEDC